MTLKIQNILSSGILSIGKSSIHHFQRFYGVLVGQLVSPLFCVRIHAHMCMCAYKFSTYNPGEMLLDFRVVIITQTSFENTGHRKH